MPDLIPEKHGIFDRHPEHIDITGFRLSPERVENGKIDFLRVHQF
jgi:hypothetical protein